VLPGHLNAITYGCQMINVNIPELAEIYIVHFTFSTTTTTLAITVRYSG